MNVCRVTRKWYRFGENSIILLSGGWYALYGTYDEKNWNSSSKLNQVLRDAHTKYGANPFFEVSVAPDWDSASTGNPAEVYMIQVGKV